MLTLIRFIIQKLRLITNRALVSGRRRLLIVGAVLGGVLLISGVSFAYDISQTERPRITQNQPERQVSAPDISPSPSGDTVEVSQEQTHTSTGSAKPSLQPKTEPVNGDFTLSTNYLELEPGATGQITLTSREALFFNFWGEGRNKVMGGLQPASPVTSHTFQISATSITKPGETYTVKFTSQRKGSATFLQTKTATVKIVGKRFDVSISDTYVSPEYWLNEDHINMRAIVAWHYGLSGTVSFNIRSVSAPVADALVVRIDSQDTGGANVVIEILDTVLPGDYVFEIEANDQTGYSTTDRFTVHLTE